MAITEISYNLVNAIREGKLEEVKHLIDIDGFSWRDWDQGFALLCEALEYNQSQMAAFLIKSGVEVRNNKPLLLAAINRDIAVAKLLLERATHSGTSPDAKDEHGQTPIIYSVQNADYPMFKLLLEHGASVKGSTGLLSCGVKSDFIEIVETLLNEGVNVDDSFKSKLGKRAIWYAVDNMNLKMVRLLVAHGAYLSDNTKLIVEWMERERELANVMSPERGVAEMKKQLNASDWGYKLLRAAVSEEYVDVVRCLLDYGADISFKPPARVTSVLFTAVAYGTFKNRSTEIMVMLLEQGANVNSRDNYGQTPLHIASSFNYSMKVINLLKCGADVNSKDANGKTPLHVAGYEDHTEVVEILLKSGADVNSKDKNGKTPLHGASYEDYLEVVKMLLKYGADVNSKDKNGKTPLHVNSFDHTDVIKILLKNGADETIKDSDGNTPLNGASYCNVQ